MMLFFLAGCIHTKVHETNKISNKLPFEPWPCFQNMTSLMQQLDLPDTGSGQGLLPGPHQVPGSSFLLCLFPQSSNCAPLRSTLCWQPCDLRVGLGWGIAGNPATRERAEEASSSSSRLVHGWSWWRAAQQTDPRLTRQRHCPLPRPPLSERPADRLSVNAGKAKSGANTHLPESLP